MDRWLKSGWNSAETSVRGGCPRGVVSEAEGADRGGAGVRQRGVRAADGVRAGVVLQGEERGRAWDRRTAAGGGRVRARLADCGAGREGVALCMLCVMVRQGFGRDSICKFREKFLCLV